MRRLIRWLSVIVFVALLALLGLLYSMRGEIQRRQAVYRVREADDYTQAQRELIWFQMAPDHEAKLDTLMHAWGRGDRQLDLHVLQFLREPQCNDVVRERFVAELSARPELLPRWAQYWRWKAEREPGVELADVRSHLELLLAADDRRSLSWRQMLDLAALFELTGQGQLAAGLTAENWPERFRAWQAAAPKKMPDVERPASPLPE